MRVLIDILFCLTFVSIGTVWIWSHIRLKISLRPIKRSRPPTDWVAIGAKLRDIREQRGMTITQAAEKLGWTFPVLAEIEEGRRTIVVNEMIEMRAVYIEGVPWNLGHRETPWNEIYDMAKEFGSEAAEDIIHQFGDMHFRDWAARAKKPLQRNK